MIWFGKRDGAEPAGIDNRFRNKSFGWAFFLVAGLWTAGAWWGEAVGLGAVSRAALVALGGVIPVTIQVATGYGLDSGWTARYSRLEHPRHYWGSLAASIAVAALFAYGAYEILDRP